MPSSMARFGGETLADLRHILILCEPLPLNEESLVFSLYVLKCSEKRTNCQKSNRMLATVFTV
jgi:hypothetical protein